MSFSGHLLDDYKKHMQMLHAEQIGDIMQSYSEESGTSDRYADKQRVGVAGVITKRVNKNTRSGEPMAFFTLSDHSMIYSRKLLIINNFHFSNFLKIYSIFKRKAL